MRRKRQGAVLVVGSSRRGRRRLQLRLGLIVVVIGAAMSSLVGLARETFFASAYGPLARDLLHAFHAEEIDCHAPIDVPDICFEARPAAAGQLAELLEEIVAQYRSAGLGAGDWRSANGVWAVELRFGEGAFGTVQVFLTEVGRGTVRGMMVLSEP